MYNVLGFLLGILYFVLRIMAWLMFIHLFLFVSIGLGIVKVRHKMINKIYSAIHNFLFSIYLYVSRVINIDINLAHGLTVLSVCFLSYIVGVVLNYVH